jgi:hypothetical protein
MKPLSAAKFGIADRGPRRAPFLRLMGWKYKAVP